MYLVYNNDVSAFIVRLDLGFFALGYVRFVHPLTANWVNAFLGEGSFIHACVWLIGCFACDCFFSFVGQGCHSWVKDGSAGFACAKIICGHAFRRDKQHCTVLSFFCLPWVRYAASGLVSLSEPTCCRMGLCAS